LTSHSADRSTRAVHVERGVEQRALVRIAGSCVPARYVLGPPIRFLEDERERVPLSDGDLEPRQQFGDDVGLVDPASQSCVPGTQRSISSARRTSSRARSCTAPCPAQRSSASASVSAS
jgi:hypothetical protein